MCMRVREREWAYLELLLFSIFIFQKPSRKRTWIPFICFELFCKIFKAVGSKDVLFLNKMKIKIRDGMTFIQMLYSTSIFLWQRLTYVGTQTGKQKKC